MTPEARFAPGVVPGEPMALAEELGRDRAVVVLPLVAETRHIRAAVARQERRARRVELPEELPGSVVPPPRPVSRESLPDEPRGAFSTGSRAGASPEGTVALHSGGHSDLLASLYDVLPSLHGESSPQASRTRRHRYRRARGFRAGLAPPLHGCGVPHGAPCFRRTARGVRPRCASSPRMAKPPCTRRR